MPSKNPYYSGQPNDHFDGLRFFNPNHPDTDRSLRISVRKGGVQLHFNHTATVSTKLRAQNLFESLRFTSR